MANCKKRLKCKTCSGMHPTCLHKEVYVYLLLARSVCLLADQTGGFDHTMIVPVWVRSVGEPEREILQYAVLNNHSNVSFVCETRCELLNLQGPATVIVDNNASAERTR